MSDNIDSSDDDIELIDYENEITKALWLPNEPKLYVIYNGHKFINYNDGQDLKKQADDESENDASEDEELVFTIENHRTHSEYMTMKQVSNFSQEALQSHSIYMLDFDSEVYIWVGSLVPMDKIVTCFNHCGHAIIGVHSKGRRRRDKAAFAFTFQGFEPEVFKAAFPSWVAFPRSGIDDHVGISEDSNEDENSFGSDKDMAEEAETQTSGELTEE